MATASYGTLVVVALAVAAFCSGQVSAVDIDEHSTKTASADIDERLALLELQINVLHKDFRDMQKLLNELIQTSMHPNGDEQAYHEEKRRNMPFLGSRGKKMVFLGSRGKRLSTTQTDKRYSMTFLGSRGRRGGLAFLGSRG